MAKPKCSACGSEAVVWGQTKSGAWMLFTTEPVLHIRICPKRRKKAQGARDSAIAEALGGLLRLGIKAGEARRLIGNTKETDVEAIIRAALARKDQSFRGRTS